MRGFDELVVAADQAAAALGLTGFAQIGHSSVLPRHLRWARFLPEEELRHRLSAARIVVCHGGMGILGEAMRAGRPILAVPRTGPTTPDHPANDQREFLQRLSAVHPIEACADPARLLDHLRRLVAAAPDRVDYRLDCDIPRIIAGFLTARRPSSIGAAERRP